jgi:hypothetical protein
VVRRHGVARGLLTAWRRQFATAARCKLPNFVPVQFDAEESSLGAVSEPDRASPVQTRLLEKVSPTGKLSGVIEIGERGAGPGRAGSGADDAFHGAVGTPRRPVIALRADLKVVLATQPIDFRKSVHTLSALVSEALHATIDALTQVKTAFDPDSKEHDRVVDLLKIWETYEERMRADGYEFIATEHGCGWLKKLNL